MCFGHQRESPMQAIHYEEFMRDDLGAEVRTMVRSCAGWEKGASLELRLWTLKSIEVKDLNKVVLNLM
jgi:hypothetical protein